MKRTDPEDFLALAAVIRAGQVDHAEAQQLLNHNDIFAAWYRS